MVGCLPASVPVAPAPRPGPARCAETPNALLVRQWSPNVILFPHTDAIGPEQRERLTARGIRVVEGPVARLVVDNDHLHGVELRVGTVVPRTAVFVRHASSRMLICSPGWAVRWMSMAGWFTIRWDASASPASGWQATPPIPAPRSSAPPGKDRPRRSPSMPTWSMRTSSAPRQSPRRPRGVRTSAFHLIHLSTPSRNLLMSPSRAIPLRMTSVPATCQKRRPRHHACLHAPTCGCATSSLVKPSRQDSSPLLFPYVRVSPSPSGRWCCPRSWASGCARSCPTTGERTW
jgi:hypothetical protein